MSGISRQDTGQGDRERLVVSRVVSPEPGEPSVRSDRLLMRSEDVERRVSCLPQQLAAQFEMACSSEYSVDVVGNDSD